MRYYFKTCLVVLIIICFASCSKKNNERAYYTFANEFENSIIKHNAKFFNFEYDGLVTQSSYFIGSKLKFLKYRHGSENGSIESLVFFDINTDSLIKIVRREILFEWDDNENVRNEKYSDTMFVVQFEKNSTYTYFDNKIIDSIFKKNVYETDIEFIKNMKNETEKKHNSH